MTDRSGARLPQASPRRGIWAAAFGVALAVLLHAGAAHAYLTDTYDALTVSPGSLELEIAPVGWLLSDGEHWLTLPTLSLYLGVYENVDVILSARGYLGPLRGPGRSFSVSDDSLYLRVLLREGSLQEAEGPSVAFIVGFLLPNINDAVALGGAGGLAVSHVFGNVATLYTNLFISSNLAYNFELFASVSAELLPDSPVRPVLEAWFDWESPSAVGVSGLAGLYIDLSDTAVIGFAGRAGWFDGVVDVEARASLWFAWTFAGDDGEDAGTGDEE